MKTVKSLISLSQSMLSCLFFVAKTLFNPDNIKKILKDTYTASSSVFRHIRVAMESNLRNGWIEPLLSKMHSLKNKRIR